MLFNSYEFLFLFLPIVLLGYYVLFARHGRLAFLTVASYLFYGWWDYRFCSLMVISTLIDYVAGKKIGRSEDPRIRKWWLVASLVSNLSLLGFFKYYNLAAETLNGAFSLFPWLNGELLPQLNVVLPVGISFYTFQSMSYSIDIYLGAARPAKNLWTFACYVALFPQLIAGPILRYRELADQMVQRTHTIQKCAAGITLFVLGLAKKVILADGVAALANSVFQGESAGLVASWLGAVSYAMQIYFDFSGYSDMAVGLGLLMGFEFPQNFHSPYKATSVTDFWRRWHISLSSWLRDYLYVPLGGNRRGPARTYVNLLVTMLLGGLWHGANWTFVCWGAIHGTLLATERMIGKRSLFWWAPAPVQRAGTFVLVLIAWVFFRAESFPDAAQVLKGLVGLGGAPVIEPGWWWADHRLPLTVLAVCAVIAWGAPNTWEIRWRPGVLLALGLSMLFVVCVGVILVNTSSPFLYFQF